MRPIGWVLPFDLHFFVTLPGTISIDASILWIWFTIFKSCCAYALGVCDTPSSLTPAKRQLKAISIQDVCNSSPFRHCCWWSHPKSFCQSSGVIFACVLGQGITGQLGFQVYTLGSACQVHFGSNVLKWFMWCCTQISCGEIYLSFGLFSAMDVFACLFEAISFSGWSMPIHAFSFASQICHAFICFVFFWYTSGFCCLCGLTAAFAALSALRFPIKSAKEIPRLYATWCVTQLSGMWSARCALHQITSMEILQIGFRVLATCSKNIHQLMWVHCWGTSKCCKT